MLMKLDPKRDLFERSEMAEIWGFLEKRANIESPLSKWVQYRALVGVLSRVGCRATECCNLKVGDVELSRSPGYLRVVRLKKKNHTVDCVEIDTTLARWLSEWVEVRSAGPDEILFHKVKSGKQWNHIELQQAWERLLRHIGVEYKRLHALRHTHLTDFYQVTKDLALTQRRAGHSDPRTTMVYVDSRLEDRAQAIEAFRLSYEPEPSHKGNIVDFPVERSA